MGKNNPVYSIVFHFQFCLFKKNFISAGMFEILNIRVTYICLTKVQILKVMDSQKIFLCLVLKHAFDLNSN